MTQEKEIEQAAREYADVARSYLFGSEMPVVQDAFEAGAEWALANQWHKVSEQTPDTERDVVVVNEYNDFGKAWFDEDGKAHASLLGEIIAWCEIPQFKEK